jgi:hypothetical protein
VAIKQGKMRAAFQFAFPSIFSLAAWKYFISLMILQKQKDALLIQKFVLIDTSASSNLTDAEHDSP